MSRCRVAAYVLVLGASCLAVAGCANREEWDVWKSNPYHFASGDHMKFSVRNREGRPLQVDRNDVELARQQNWFGKAITVREEELLER